MFNSQRNNTVLMIAATPFFSDRGCHIRIYNEIKYLKRNKIDVILSTYHLGYNPPGILEKNIKRIANIPWYKKITPGASWHKLYLDFLLLTLSFKWFLKIKPKIIHAHLYEGLLIAFIIKLFSFRRVKIVFDCQGSLAEEMYAYTLHKSLVLKPFHYLFLVIEKMLLYIPDKTLCSSKNSYDFLTSKYKVPADKIDILNDGMDSDLFDPPRYDKVTTKEGLGIPENRTIILYTGSLSEAKGVKGLLDAIPLILEKSPTFAFVFAGYGDLESEYKIKLIRYIESKNVFFAGRFSYFDLPRYTGIADFAIDPKRNSSESSGKLLNYIAAGMPVICFKNKLNLEALGDQGIFINSFKEIISFKKQKPYTKTGLNWNQEVVKLISSYESF